MSKSLGNVVDPMDVRSGITLEASFSCMHQLSMSQHFGVVEVAREVERRQFGSQGVWPVRMTMLICLSQEMRHRSLSLCRAVEGQKRQFPDGIKVAIVCMWLGSGVLTRFYRNVASMPCDSLCARS